jgi:hypothetical protein
MQKFFLGFTICAIVVLIIFICYGKVSQANELISLEKQTIQLLRDTAQKNIQPSINELNIKTLTLDEKISSVNKRFDDFYILGGLIIALLLAINIGLFVKTQSEVEDYFKNNFDIHLKRVMDYENRSAVLFGQINTYVEYVKKTISTQNPGEPTITEENTNNDTAN